ncbi:uncharacterized protein PGTG_07026 [Puccinia graminis f. sp. tritici CRL 75-36-700-3]|uniref:Amino acid permease/ SLC12A domain-containing protein n=1 Tax=Puccinia graminis f. sp. tritici (strain CRL 75-36-700-3 / race SCCL) TaxID=418459 RepID=E3KAI8_PUCGT|nr:uncharacterized protein PGTG_07026 [Puccinia graminis f. sp. tritici CRL 75-36-700-3]EFP81405.2 hypothetical protein PGTG_07026 [Puccinia graminis f. sp. tritici CRL 75-36-700-3]
MAQKYEHAVPQPLVAPPLPLKDFEVMFNDEENGGYLPEKVGHPPPKAMKRKLKERQLTMMSIGGTIGTGLFLGMGSSLNDGGPMGLLLGYLIMGTVVCSVQMALGEMITYMPCHGALTTFPARFVDPALGFSVGWNYWYSFAICVAGEVTAAAIVVDYWKAPVSQGVWITLFFVTACAINFFGVKCYGEKFLLLAAVKVFAITALVVLGLVLNLGGGPTHEFIGLKYWKDPGLFRQLNDIPGASGRFLAFWSVFIQAAYSFLGSETVALAAAETENPRKTVPRAIKSVFYRLLLFYVASAFVIGLVVPFNDPQLLGGTGDASSSPFVIAINRSKIKILPDLINAVVLVSAYSATSSEVYCGSRVLHGLVIDRMAPQIFGKVNSSGNPINALIASALPGLLAFMNLSEKSGTVFLWLVNISAMGGIFTWWSVCLTYIRFHKGLKARGVDRDRLDYKAPFQPYLSYYGVVMLAAIILMSGFKVFLNGQWQAPVQPIHSNLQSARRSSHFFSRSWGSFIGAYITLPIFGLTYLFW